MCLICKKIWFQPLFFLLLVVTCVTVAVPQTHIDQHDWKIRKFSNGRLLQLHWQYHQQIGSNFEWGGKLDCHGCIFWPVSCSVSPRGVYGKLAGLVHFFKSGSRNWLPNNTHTSKRGNNITVFNWVKFLKREIQSSCWKIFWQKPLPRKMDCVSESST